MIRIFFWLLGALAVLFTPMPLWLCFIAGILCTLFGEVFSD